MGVWHVAVAKRLMAAENAEKKHNVKLRTKLKEHVMTEKWDNIKRKKVNAGLGEGVCCAKKQQACWSTQADKTGSNNWNTKTMTTLWMSWMRFSVQLDTISTQHFRNSLHSQSLDWCKTLSLSSQPIIWRLILTKGNITTATQKLHSKQPCNKTAYTYTQATEN